MMASPDWEGQRIYIILGGSELALYEELTKESKLSIFGGVKEGAVYLPLQEAEDLAQDILNACQEYRRIETECQEYFRKEREKK